MSRGARWRRGKGGGKGAQLRYASMLYAGEAVGDGERASGNHGPKHWRRCGLDVVVQTAADSWGPRGLIIIQIF
jgi:hypothetical protein